MSTNRKTRAQKPKKRTIVQQRRLNQQPRQPQLLKRPLLKKIGKFFTSVWGGISILATVGGVIALFHNGPITNWFQTPHDNFIDERYIVGVFAPFYAGQNLNVCQGGGTFSAPISPAGVVDNIAPAFGCVSKNDFSNLQNELQYGLKIRNHSFLLTVTIRDLKTGEVIASIVDNKWEVKKTGIADYSDNNLIEILDNYGYVAFSMWVDDKQTLQMRGYIVGEQCTYFMNGDTLEMVERSDPHYIQKCEHLASLLKPRSIKKAI